MVKDLSVELCGIRLQNPVIPASGTFGFGLELAGSFGLDVLGAISLKGTALEPRYGNLTPRVAECTEGMINSVGLQNPGIDVFCERDLPFLKEYDTNVIVNVCGKSISDYVEVVERLGEESRNWDPGRPEPFISGRQFFFTPSNFLSISLMALMSCAKKARMMASVISS